ncbi:MAG: hypothetical protein HZA17_01470, partial [Nitrospirae bacterium]|nr:hypothetical protein [Nitrospirota bacterium]
MRKLFIYFSEIMNQKSGWRTFLYFAAVLSVMGQSAMATAQDGLVGHWTLNDGNGQVAVDTSGNGNNGQLGSTLQADSNDPAWTTGIYGTTALHFEATGVNYVKIQDVAVLEPQRITLEAWVKHLGSPGSFAYIAAKGVTLCQCSSYALYTGSSGGL